MAKFTGFMCDVCKTAENGNDRPEHWLRLYLPVVSNVSNNERDLCSDKCLLKFAKERNGVAPAKSGSNRSKSDPALVDFLKEHGLKGGALGGTIGNHVRRRHEIAGAVDDCLVCEFLTTKGGE